MKKYLCLILLIVLNYQYANAKPVSDNESIKLLEEKCATLQSQQSHTASELKALSAQQKENEQELLSLADKSSEQSQAIDSLLKVCKQMEQTQSADRKAIDGRIGATDDSVKANADLLNSRSLWAAIIAVVLLLVLIGIARRFSKRIKSGNSSIDEVRKAQEALRAAQVKMQEESVKLDDKLLELFDKQMSETSKSDNVEKPDHSLALKVADEIVRIELNMSRMDSSIRGYKQLAKAVERIKDNFKANGYEIIDMLGQPYNEGMKVTASFVIDEEIEEGKQIITGITKPQINYNGQMIQAAQITVSQNI